MSEISISDSSQQKIQMIRNEIILNPIDSSDIKKEQKISITTRKNLSISPKRLDKVSANTIRRQAISPMISVNNFIKASDEKIKPQMSNKRDQTRFINIKESVELKPTNSFKEKLKNYLEHFLDHNIEITIMSILTVFCLFGTDFKQLLLPPHYDDIFDSFFIFVMSVFFLEFCASTWAKSRYIYSFFFWLDLSATISMLLEVDWILIPLVDFILG